MNEKLPFATPIPRTHLLSCGRHAVMLTAAGSGFSQWNGCAITRWREDVTRDCWGSYVYLRDVGSAQTWSAGLQPVGAAPDEYTVAFDEASASITRRDGTITTTTELAVVADGVEIRRLSLANDGDSDREIEITTYAELVLAPAANDASHPAFSKLFVQTEFAADRQLLLATRRLRSPSEQSVWAAQWLAVEGGAVGHLQWETDRARFIGRGHSLRNPAALEHEGLLSGSVGTVLDPIFSLRRRVRVASGDSARLLLCTAVAATRDEVLALVQAHQQIPFVSNADHFMQTAQASVDDTGLKARQAQCFQRMAGALLYSDRSLRATADAIAAGAGGAPTLWAGGISGDYPIVLLTIQDRAGLALVDELLQAHAFWTGKCLTVDLVVLNEAATDAQALDDTLRARVEAYVAKHLHADADKPHVFAPCDKNISSALHAGLLTAARIVLDQQRGSLADQVKELPTAPHATNATMHSDAPVQSPDLPDDSQPGSIESGLERFNGYGGFDKDGREYVTIVRAGQRPPMPWINVIANPEFGFTATEAGAGYTWSLNSQKNPLTPWANDPVVDPPQEVLYIRDENDGSVWTPVALLGSEAAGNCIARHGHGYSRFERRAHGIDAELVQFVPIADGVKISRLRLRNRSGRTRRLSVTAYVEWALGSNGSQPRPYIVTSIDAQTGALFARNAWREDFGARIAFIDLRGRQQSHGGDRSEFLGRHGSVQSPAALSGTAPLSGLVGAGLDPCGALQVSIEIAADAQDEIVLLLGDAEDAEAAQALVRRYRGIDPQEVLDAVTGQWNEILDTVQVRTPDRAMDLLLNRWLLYQTLACRLWARTAYYQASGAFGFRDQLQDVMALCVARPDLAREHLLCAAGRQFVEGDVQHWWLPPSGAGIRTRMTDDRLWLPYVACHYLEVTADDDVLDTRQAFLAGDTLKPGQEDAYFVPAPSDEEASLYEHCARAIDVSLTLGAHGLPLIGTGDWNDGMNRVGEQGKGESVWLGWFLVATIDAFAPIAQARGDVKRAQHWRELAASVRTALDADGWDGDWYRRGYYDDGTPLGSRVSAECQIDAIAQSWSVIAGGCDPDHAESAMASVERLLIRHNDKVAMLFTPPFDKVEENPGYIKAYPPGIRENGGQYTHGSQWSIFALAGMGQGDRAAELFALINPIHHSPDLAAVDRYQVEPYVACADVYSVAPHVGRGGWTWYTGSGGWLYRAGIEAILGFRVQGDSLLMDPCIPADWPGFSIAYRHRSARYTIEVENPQHAQRGVAAATLDGEDLAVGPCRIPLRDDGAAHQVRVTMGMPL